MSPLHLADRKFRSSFERRYASQALAMSLSTGGMCGFALVLVGSHIGPGAGVPTLLQVLLVFFTALLVAAITFGIFAALQRTQDVETMVAPARDESVPPANQAGPSQQLEAQIARTLAKANRENGGIAVLMLAIDQYKDLYSAMGPGFADALESETALQLKLVVRSEETALKLADNRFVVILQFEKGISITNAIASRISGHFNRVMAVGGEHAAVTVSIGYSEDLGAYRQAGTLLREAEVALAEALGQGGNTVVKYERAHDDIALARNAIMRDLRIALARQEQLALVYQPIIDVRTREIWGAEALLRWHHDIHGRLSAPFLIGLARDAGELPRLTRWTLERALETLDATSLRVVSVNISSDQLADAGALSELVQFANDRLHASSMRNRLHLDLHPDTTGDSVLLERVRTLSSAGYSVTLDGLTAGGSVEVPNLATSIAGLPVKAVKIDALSFADLAADNEAKQQLGQLVEVLAGNDIALYAKNVETGDMLLQLDTFGINRQQGYIHCGAVTGQTLAAMVEDSRELRAG